MIIEFIYFLAQRKLLNDDINAMHFFCTIVTIIDSADWSSAAIPMT